MQVANLEYLTYHIRIEIPHPEYSRSLYLYLSDRTGYVFQHFPYTARGNNPDLWVLEALEVAIQELPTRLTIVEPPTNAVDQGQDLDDIPF